MPSVLEHCWLGIRKSIRPVKIGAGVVICLERRASDLHMVQLMTLYHSFISCFTEIQPGLTFPVLAYPGCPGKEAVKRTSVCVCHTTGMRWQDRKQSGVSSVCDLCLTLDHDVTNPHSSDVVNVIVVDSGGDEL